MTANRFIVDNRLDLETFGRELARAMNMGVEVDSPGSLYPCVTIVCEDGLELSLRAAYGSQLGKVEVYATTPFARGLDHYERPEMPSAGVNTSRDIGAIARDLIRRVVDPARGPVEAARDALAKRRAETGQLSALSASLMKRFPGLSINHRENEKHADVYFNKGGCYLTGSIDANGRLNIQRFSVSSPAQSAALLALISSTGAE